MAYRNDSDLSFLAEIKSNDLNDLVYCLTHDKDGDSRLTEELTASAPYKMHYPNHKEYWELIAAEIQCFGANSLVTMLRGGKGVLYKEILIDVCDKVKVNYNKISKTETIENNLLMKILTDAIEKMTPEELKELAGAVGIPYVSALNPEAFIAIFQSVFRAGGFKSYQLTLIVVNAILKALIGRGLTFAGNAALMKTMSILAGPIGLAVTSLWTVIDIASPAYRVTIPAVIQVAALRQKYIYEKQAEQISFS